MSQIPSIVQYHGLNIDALGSLLFAKVFQEHENGTEVFRHLCLLQKMGPGHSQGTTVCYQPE